MVYCICEVPNGKLYDSERNCRQMCIRDREHTAFPGVVAVLSVILAVQLFAGSVSCGRNSGLPCAAFDLGNMEVK